MRQNKVRIWLAMVVSILFIVVVKDIPLTQIQAIPDKLNITKEDIIAVNQDNLFGKYIVLKTDFYKDTKKERPLNSKINFKLFGFIPVGSTKIAAADNKEVYVGGEVVGFSLTSEGLIVVGSNSVLTKEGRVDTLKNSDLQVGDIIKEIEGEKLYAVEQLEEIINKREDKDKEVEMKVIRKNKEIDIKLKPALDMQTKKYKMGLWVKDDAAGIGTLTYIRQDNGRFGALGHAICDVDTKVPFSVNEGKLHRSRIIGIKKGRQGVPGEIKGLFVKGEDYEGTVDKNMEFGVFGVVNKDCSFCKELEALPIGGRLSARPGKAKLRASLDGEGTKDYDIEIIKTNYQNISKQKSMVIRVVDKDLIARTGGIIQGMSGSPIIQQGKVVGAVTHVFVNDPKKGFGVYLDWMINE